MTIRIGICGKAGAGKTTLANAIADECETRGMHTRVVAFADKLKEICTDVFGMKDKDRKLLQRVGMAMRNVDERVWIDYLIRVHDDEAKYDDDNNCIVVHDVRFLNEAEALLSKGYTLVHLGVDRDTQLDRGRCVGHNHVSETGVDELMSLCSFHNVLLTMNDTRRLAQELVITAIGVGPKK